MPRVQTYGPRRVSTDPIPGARKTAAETETSTGASLELARAQKYETLAGVASQVARHAIGVVSREAEEERLAADETAVLEARTTVGQWVNKRLNDPETGALAVRGKDALGLPEVVDAEYQKVVNELQATLHTDRQRRGFAREAAQDRLNLYGTLYRHVANEQKTYEAGVLEATLTTETSTAINNANDPRRIGEALQRGTTAIELLGPKLGLSVEQREVMQRKLATNIHAGVIDRLLVDDKHRAAAAYFEETNSQIDGAAIARIENALETGKLRAEAQQTADAIIAAGGTLTQQREKARAIDDPKVRDEVMQRVEHEAAVREREERELEERRSIEGYDILDKTNGDVSKIPSTLWSTYSGPQRAAKRAYGRALAKGEPVETDALTYYSLMQQAAGAPGYGTPADFVKQNLLDYSHKLSEADRKQLINLQYSIRTNNREGVDKDLAGFRTKHEILENTLAQYGIDPKDKDQAPAIAQLSRMLDLRIEAAQATGQKVTNVEIQQALDDLLKETETVPGSWWNIWPGGQSFTDATRRSLDLVVEIPVTERAQIEDALRRKGQPITSANILKIWREHKR